MDFDTNFKAMLLQNRELTEIRILRLDSPIPPNYISNMNLFMEKFFEDDPFDIRPQDLETYITPDGKIKKLKFDRRPSSFLSILRFLELYRQQLKSIKGNLHILAVCYKKFEANDQIDPINSELKNKILNSLLAAGRVLKKWTPQTEELFKITLKNINLAIAESETINGRGKGFVNLRKIHGENFLNANFQPYYENLINFCLLCMAFNEKLKLQTIDFSTQSKAIWG